MMGEVQVVHNNDGSDGNADEDDNGCFYLSYRNREKSSAWASLDLRVIH